MRQYQDIKLNLSTGCSNIQQEHDHVPTRKTGSSKIDPNKNVTNKKLTGEMEAGFFLTNIL